MTSPKFQHGAQTKGHDLGSLFSSLLRLEMPFSHSTLGAVPLFRVFSRGNTTENGSVSAQRSTWQGAKHLKIEGLCQFFDIWKNCFRNLHKICLLMELCYHSAKHFHIHVVLCVWSCHIDVRHVRIFVTPSSFYVLLQSDGKARCFFGIKMPAEWQNFIENPNCPVLVLDWAGMYLRFWGMRQAGSQKWFLNNDFLFSCKKTHFYKTGFALSLVLKVKGHGLYAISTFPIMHLTCPPKFCISIVFDFSWDGCNTQEKWKTKLLRNFGGR